MKKLNFTIYCIVTISLDGTLFDLLSIIDTVFGMSFRRTFRPHNIATDHDELALQLSFCISVFAVYVYERNRKDPKGENDQNTN